jgi:glycosyltransferase involved in cell wall biosynthesis
MKLLERPRTGNWVVNTNHALSEASGEYINFLHQDDLWFPNRLKIMRALTTAYPQGIFFLHPAYYLDDAGNKLGLWKCPLPAVPRIIEPQLMLEKLLVQNFIAIPSPVFKREVARRVGGLESTFWYTADWDFWLKMAACGNSLYYPQPLSGFRIHSGSQTITRSSQLDDFRSQLETVAQRYFDLWDAPERRKKSVRKVVDFSIEVNVALAGKVHGHKVGARSLLMAFLGLGPAGWHRYIRDSRILERVAARVKAGIKPLKAPSGPREKEDT